MRTGVIIRLIVSLVFIVWFGCSDSDNNSAATPTRPEVSGELDSRLVSANTDFGFRLLDELHTQGGEENLFISPLSVSIALSMTYNGAVGETQQAMAETLTLEGLDLEAINESNAALQNELLSLGEKVEVSLANSIWSRQGVEFKPDFLERNRQYFAAEVAALDFDDPNAVNTVNDWVKNNTRDKIDKIVDSISPDTVMILLNAIYFKGQWQIEFDKEKTRTLPFHLADGTEKQVMMMSRTGAYQAYQGENFEAARLPYGDGRVAMYIFLPNPDASIPELIAQLNAENWESWLAQFHEKGGSSELILPRFKLEYEESLKKALTELGMGIAFTDSADFSGMRENVFISEVKHKSIIEVNEEGTEAAAVTGVIVVETSLPIPFLVDRPFFFAIRDDRTKAILFMGVVYEPM